MEVLSIAPPNDDIYTIGIADNCLRDPEECIKFVFNELTKAGHKIMIYSYHPELTPRYEELKRFINGLGVKDVEIHKRKDIDCDIFIDERNIGGAVPISQLFLVFFTNRLIPPTVKNKNMCKDHQFWATGKESFGIISSTQEVRPSLITFGSGIN